MRPGLAVLATLLLCAAGCGSSDNGETDALHSDAGALIDSGGNDAPTIQIFVSDTATQPPPPATGAICTLGSDQDLPACPAEARADESCDGSVPACRATADGASTTFVCQNTSNGRPLSWTQAYAVDIPCAERKSADCTLQQGASDEERAYLEVTEILDRCLGNESWIVVAFQDGCVTHFAASIRRPDQLSCLQMALGDNRYTCASSATCIGASLSTLP